MSALIDYVRATPELEHHLVYRTRRGEQVWEDDLVLFATVSLLPRGSGPAIRELRRTIRLLAPDVIHAHSSLAGAGVRLVTVSRPDRRIVYTPHGFSFERLDLSGTVRGLYRFLEWAMMWNTDVVAGCSRREVALARVGHPRARVIYVPNIAGPPLSLPLSNRGPSGTRLVMGCGRLTRAKGIEFFLAVVMELRQRRSDTEAEWVGGGDPETARWLEAAGVRVTGWMSRSAARTRVGVADVYVHTAAWEGFPLTVLEARAFGVPVVARRIEALADASSLVLGDSPADLATMIHTMFEDSSGETLARMSRSWDECLSQNNVTTQRERLLECYSPPSP